MQFTYDALWKTLKNKDITLETLAKELEIPQEEVDAFKQKKLVSMKTVEKIRKRLCCELSDVLDETSFTACIRYREPVSEALDSAIAADVRAKIYHSISGEDRYILLNVNPDICDFALQGRFVTEDFIEYAGFIEEAIRELKADIDMRFVRVEIEPREKEDEEDEGDEEQKRLLDELEKKRRELMEKLSRIIEEDSSEKDQAKEAPGEADSAQKEQEKEEPAKATSTPKETPPKAAPASENVVKDMIDRIISGEPNEQKQPSPLDEVRKDVNELVGAKEFRTLCNEIIAAAPQFQSPAARKVFLSQCYLFSIGTGGGLTTALNLLGRVITETGIVAVSGDCREFVISYEPKPEAITSHLNELYEKIFEMSPVRIPRMGRGGVQIPMISLDISEWIDHIGNFQFREFLRKVSTSQENVIVVFRIPFVEKDVLLKVREALNDALYVRMVSFPPFSAEDYRTLTKLELSKNGFSMESAAWKYIEKRLNEEKSDGTFYGIKTLRKVVNELLYKKAVTNATMKNPSHRITVRDTRALAEFSAEDSLCAEEMLSALVGMDEVKKQLNEILTQIEFSRAAKGMGSPTIHMRFVGNPGTGKTTVARILGKILKEKGILRIGNFFEYTGRDFCGRYIGETTPKTQMMCRDAYGSVLFIDEAYTLYKGDNDKKDYGREALDTLISEMENHRDDLLVIMAGYPDDMENLMQGNSGLRSRIPYLIDFRNFTRDELYKIFEAMVKKNFKYDDEILPVAKEFFEGLEDKLLESKEFSNGRFVRNIFERTWAKAAMRRDLDNGKLRLSKEDFLLSVSDQEFKKDLKDGRKSKRIGFGNAMN